MKELEVFLEGFELKGDLKENFYMLSFPSSWIKFFKDYLYSSDRGQLRKLVKTTSLREIIYSITPEIVYCGDCYVVKENEAWILSKELIDFDILIYTIQQWGKAQLVNIKDYHIKQEFQLWLSSIKTADLEEMKNISVNLLVDGVDNTEGKIYDIIPKLLALDLINKSMNINNNQVSFVVGIKKGKSILYSTPTVFKSKKGSEDYFSICLEFSLQTLPSERKYKLLYTPRISRWIMRPIHKAQLDDRITVYKKISDQYLFTLEIVRDRKRKCVQWDPQSQYLCKKSLGVKLPEAEDWLKNPYVYFKDDGLYGLYHARMGKGKTSIESGLSMKDKWDIYEGLKTITDKWVNCLDGVKSFKQKPFSIEEFKFSQEQLLKTTGKENLIIEVYTAYEHELYPILKEELESILEQKIDNNPYIKLNLITKPDLLEELDTSKGELERYEYRISQFESQIEKATDMRVAFVFLPYKDVESGSDYFKKSNDPKKAIRAGLARQGRLTQFIDDRILTIGTASVDDVLKDEGIKDARHRIKSAILDMIRQIGYLPLIKESKSNQMFRQLSVTGMHIVNFKKTPYGNLNRFALFITFNPSQEEIRVECPALWRGAKRYWEACLQFQQLATLQAYQSVNKTKINQDIKQKVLTLMHDKTSDHLLIIDGNGVSRNYWPLLTNKTLNMINKKDVYTLKEIMFDKDNKIPITDDCSIRIIRTRMNSEVFNYLTALKDNGAYIAKSGIQKYNDMFYSIGSRPNDPLYKNSYKNFSKIDYPQKQCKLPDMIEIYPIHLKSEDKALDWISYVHKYRGEAIQYEGTLRNTLVLHLAMKLEEYIF